MNRLILAAAAVGVFAPAAPLLAQGGRPAPSTVAPASAVTTPTAAVTMTAGGAATRDGSFAVPLAPGDMIRVSVWRRPEFSGDFTVGADGAISHPLFRVVRVTDVPFSVVQTRLADFLRRFEEDPQFVAEPLLRVTVRGEIERPNVYMLAPSTTLAQALSTAGGANERGQRDRLTLVRDGAATKIELKAETDAARMPIRSGDELVVDRQRSLFREYVMPVATIIGAIAASANVILRANR